MPRFGNSSLAKLDTCEIALQAILLKVIEYMDFTIVCGVRSEQEQNDAYLSRASKVMWPNSKHNRPSGGLSLAVDIAPFNSIEKIDWDDSYAFCVLAGRVQQVADELSIPIRWGGDWDMDDQSNDQGFMDIGHFELLA